MPPNRRELLRHTFAGLLYAAAAPAAVGTLTGCGRDGPAAALIRDEGRLATARWPGQRPRWLLVRPDPARVPRPHLVVALHGRGGSADDVVSLGLDEQAVAAGVALAAVDGGERYWHPRRGGEDTGAMVVEDLLPVLREHGVAAGPIGLTGLSMGGYGALWLAIRFGPSVIGAVATQGAALWTSPGASAAGAFDDRADFVAHDVFAAVERLRGIPVHLACGDKDPFVAANKSLAQRLPHAVTTFDQGGHDDAYWRPHAAAAVRWLAGVAASGPSSPMPRPAAS